MQKNKISGKHKGDIMIFALSTCGWCRRTKELLKNLGVEFHYVDVDLASDNDRDEIEKELNKWNPSQSFPTIVINNSKCIVGFKEDEIKEAVK